MCVSMSLDAVTRQRPQRIQGSTVKQRELGRGRGCGGSGPVRPTPCAREPTGENSVQRFAPERFREMIVHAGGETGRAPGARHVRSQCNDGNVHARRLVAAQRRVAENPSMTGISQSMRMASKERV